MAWIDTQKRHMTLSFSLTLMYSSSRGFVALLTKLMSCSMLLWKSSFYSNNQQPGSLLYSRWFILTTSLYEKYRYCWQYFYKRLAVGIPLKKEGLSSTTITSWLTLYLLQRIKHTLIHWWRTCAFEVKTKIWNLRLEWCVVLAERCVKGEWTLF